MSNIVILKKGKNENRPISISLVAFSNTDHDRNAKIIKNGKKNEEKNIFLLLPMWH